MPTIDVPEAARLAPLDSITVPLPEGAPAFVVRLDEGFVVYRNLCPHWNVDLDLGLGDFVDRRVGRIACRNHGAEFELESGRCVLGPCVGDRLEPVTHELVDGVLRLRLDPR